MGERRKASGRTGRRVRFRTLSGCNRTLSDLQDTASDRRHMHNGSIRPVRPVPPVRQRHRKRKILFAAVVWRFQSLEVEQTRKIETNKGPLFIFFFFFFFFLSHIFIVKLQEIAWRTSYGKSKTQRTNNPHASHPLLGKCQAPQD